MSICFVVGLKVLRNLDPGPVGGPILETWRCPGTPAIGSIWKKKVLSGNWVWIDAQWQLKANQRKSGT